MYYLVNNQAYRTDIIVDDHGIIVYPTKYFGRPMYTTDVYWDTEYEEWVEDEAQIDLIECSRSLKKLKKTFRPWRKRTDYGRLTHALKHGRLCHGEEAVEILRKRREKRTYDSVCKIAKELFSINRRRRAGS